MVVRVYSLELLSDGFPLVTRKQLESVLFHSKPTQYWQSQVIQIGDLLLLQDGFFEVSQDYTLIEIFPTNEEMKGHRWDKDIWVDVQSCFLNSKP